MQRLAAPRCRVRSELTGVVRGADACRSGQGLLNWWSVPGERLEVRFAAAATSAITFPPRVEPPQGSGMLRVFEQQNPISLRSAIILLPLLLLSSAVLRSQEAGEEIEDITGTYQFLSADDTLALLEEDGKLKGYIDVFQGEEESDVILSYPISIGWRKKKQVEFKTRKIHQRYYRFNGTVERGSGHGQRDPDYLRLIGDLEIITVKDDTEQETTQRMHVTFKSRGHDEERDQ